MQFHNFFCKELNGAAKSVLYMKLPQLIEAQGKFAVGQGILDFEWGPCNRQTATSIVSKYVLDDFQLISNFSSLQ